MMKPLPYREQWVRLRQEGATSDELVRLARRIAYSFLDSYLKDCSYEKEYIDLLCEMTAFSKEGDAGAAAHALFAIIVERLCDEFEELQTLTYNRVMAQVISFCRRLPAGTALDQELKAFDIDSFEALMDRMQHVRANGSSFSPGKDIKKIVLLSRVTIGADVAITSVVIQRLKQFFPQAKLILVGEGKLKEIFGPDAGVTVREVAYERKGGVLERLSTWLQVLQAVRREERECPPQNMILVDPDSRYSQLGVLPIVPLERYLFFDSRSQSAYNRKMSMAEYVNDWMGTVFGDKAVCYPKVWISRRNLELAARFRHRLRRCGALRIVVMNFGVGGNSRKRVGAAFEEKMLLALLNEPGTVVFLDKGAGGVEASGSEALLQAVQASKYPVAHARLDSEPQDPLFSRGAIGVEATIGEIGALISVADEFIGYDSACQHIAAALGTPCVTVFAGSNNMRFIRRWSAFGSNSCRIVHVDTLTDPVSIDPDDITARVMHARRFHPQDGAVDPDSDG